jgi:hypothetical protein
VSRQVWSLLESIVFVVIGLFGVSRNHASVGSWVLFGIGVLGLVLKLWTTKRGS